MDVHVNAAEFRSRFAGLADMTYLASCSQGALSDELSAALAEFQQCMLALGNPWGAWAAKVEEARVAFAAYIGASADEIAIVSCASEGAYQVASGYDYSARNTVVTTELEFPSIAHVWLGQRPRGAKVRFAPTNGGFADLDGYAAAIDDTTALVSTPLVTYRHGQRLPVADIADIAHRSGARTFVDVYQAAGVEPINVDDLRCDYLVAGTLKYLLGVPGLAFLYVRAGVRHDVDPQLTGWFGRRDPFSFDPRELDFADTARRFEVGSPSVAAAYGALAGLALLAPLDARVVRDHIAELTASLDEQLRAAGEQIGSPPDAARRGPQVAIRDNDPVALADYLAGRRIITSPRTDLLRIALHYYSDQHDIDTVVSAIADYRAL
ncbi:MAG TPA: aminotransferase class V-fold PLP-dependent enzyme [Pseudonocardiaceae bacterium]